MNETTKTLVFVVAALGVAAAAFATRPQLNFQQDADDTGQLFYPEFKDVAKAASLELTRFDEATGDVIPFKVAKQGGRWVLPSHENYPADAEKKIGQAATSLLDLKKLGIASKLKADHEKLGVVDPATAQPGAKGTGLKTLLSDEGGKPLVSLIVGKEVPDDPKQRFVREPNRDTVYRTAINPAQLSSKFDDWIEKDLLKLNAWDIASVNLNNYSVDFLNQRMSKGDRLDLAYNDQDSKWTLADLKSGEELNAETLNALKTALDDLKIVDVRRKPAGLSAMLRQDEGGGINREAVESLAEKGFMFTQDGDLLSNEGEAVVRMKDGVSYVLRFGDIAGKAAAAEDKEGKAAEPTGANRYLFVMAQFDPDRVEKPMLEPLPEATGPAPASDSPASEPAATEGNAAEPKPAEAAPAEGNATNPQPGVDGDGAGGQPPAEPKPSEQPAAGPAAVTAPPAEAPDALALERQRIEQENKRKQDEYEKKLADGAKRAQELNDRFADWYYVISDDVYKKIHLSRRDVIKASDKPPISEGGDVKQFNDLQTQGIEGGAPPAAPAQPGAPAVAPPGEGPG